MIKNTYVEFDSLFDTRLPIAFLLDQDGTAEFVKSDKYRNRMVDNYNNISYFIFRDFYKNRDKRVLKLALSTPMIDLLKEHYIDMIMDIKDVTREDLVKIYINFYPYRLTDSEINNIKLGILTKIPKCNIEMIYKSPVELTPTWVANNINTMFMYDALNWLEYHTSTKEVFASPLLNVHMIAPMLVVNNIRNMKIDNEYFKKLEKSLHNLIDIQFAPSMFFSAIEF